MTIAKTYPRIFISKTYATEKLNVHKISADKPLHQTVKNLLLHNSLYYVADGQNRYCA